MKYIGNSFSLGMIPKGHSPRIHELCSAPNLDFLSKLNSVVGHESTARILGVVFNRATIILKPGDELIVAQYDGPRLPEGATTLPEGACFRWFFITIE